MERHSLICDKCGQPVPENNDASVLEIFLGEVLNDKKLSSLAFKTARHLFPVTEGKIPCAGSPSRLQYFEGFPKDKRYPYNPDLEKPHREALVKMLEKHPRN